MKTIRGFSEFSGQKIDILKKIPQKEKTWCRKGWDARQSPVKYLGLFLIGGNKDIFKNYLRLWRKI